MNDPAVNESRPLAVCVLGMHRSGTSTVARAVNLLGGYLGEKKDLLAPAPENPEGFWERKDIIELNKRVMEAFGSGWDSGVPLPQGWSGSDKARPFLEEAKALLKDKFGGRPFWAWKDPRTTLMIEIWQDALGALDVDVKYIFVVRNPLDVARSLEKRNRIDINKGIGIWFNYNITALKSVVGKNCVFVLYDRIVDGWEAEMKRCACALGLPWPEGKALEELRERMSEFVKPKLRHSLTSLESLNKAGAPAPAIELYETLLCLAKREATKEDLKTIDRLWTEFNGYSAFFRADAERAVVCSEIEELRNSLSWRITAPLRRILDFIKG